MSEQRSSGRFAIIPTRALEDPRVQPAALRTLLFISTHADPDGWCYPKAKTLAARMGVSRTAVVNQIRALTDLGYIEVRRQFAPNGAELPALKRVLYDTEGVSSPDVTGGVTPRRDTERPKGTSKGVGARAGGRGIRFGGREVPEEAWATTTRALDAFNAVTGKSLATLNGRGQPTENAKRILGRALDYPALTADQHEDIIRRTLASKWWGDGPPTVGVVYGPKVFEDNITRPAAQNGRGPTEREGTYAGDLSRFDD